MPDCAKKFGTYAYAHSPKVKRCKAQQVPSSFPSHPLPDQQML